MTAKILKEPCPRAAMGCKGSLARTGEAWKLPGGNIRVEYKCIQCERTVTREGPLDRDDFRSYNS